MHRLPRAAPWATTSSALTVRRTKAFAFDGVCYLSVLHPVSVLEPHRRLCVWVCIHMHESTIYYLCTLMGYVCVCVWCVVCRHCGCSRIHHTHTVVDQKAACNAPKCVSVRMQPVRMQTMPRTHAAHGLESMPGTHHPFAHARYWHRPASCCLLWAHADGACVCDGVELRLIQEMHVPHTLV